MRTLIFILALSFITSRNKVFPAEMKGICKDYWPGYCKLIKDSCKIHGNWMKKYCPVTCGMCIEIKHVNPCQYHKCPYHSRCTVFNVHSAKCLCQNLFDCPKQHSLVCGTDRITYRNNCTLEAIACRLKKNIKVHSTGFCKFPCAHVKCRNFAVCQVSSDGIGKCREECETCEECLSIPRPVCGKDGVTYYNQCFWKVKSCKENTRTPLARRGKCAITGAREKIVINRTKNSCHSNMCPYYMLCREVNGVPTCVKICPRSSCSCVHSAEYYQHRNGCLLCRCKMPYLTSA